MLVGEAVRALSRSKASSMLGLALWLVPLVAGMPGEPQGELCWTGAAPPTCWGWPVQGSALTERRPRHRAYRGREEEPGRPGRPRRTR